MAKLFTLWFIFVTLTLSQSHAQDSITNDTLPNWSLTCTPSGLVGFYPSFQLGVEKKFSKIVRSELDLGFIFYRNYVGRPVKGRRAKLAFKIGPADRLNFFFNFHYRRIVRKDSRWNSPDGIFEQFEEFEVYRRRIGTSIGMGKRYKATDRLWGEWSTSIGSGRLKIYEINENGVRRDVLATDRVPVFDISLKLLYAL